MPTNLYGPGDTFDLNGSHVLPALIGKFHEAKLAGGPSVTVRGSGTPRREFRHVDDMADACVFLMGGHVPLDMVNVGTGEDVAIAEAAEWVRYVVGHEGEIVRDRTEARWHASQAARRERLVAARVDGPLGLREGFPQTYDWYLAPLPAAAPSARPEPDADVPHTSVTDLPIRGCGPTQSDIRRVQLLIRRWGPPGANDRSTSEGRARERQRRVMLASAPRRLLRPCVADHVRVRSARDRLPRRERYGLWLTISSVSCIPDVCGSRARNGLLNAISDAEGRDDPVATARAVSSAFFMLVALALPFAVPARWRTPSCSGTGYSTSRRPKP
jgi:hypothetical protein